MKSILSSGRCEVRVERTWRKARIAARLLLKMERAQTLSPRDRVLARRLAADPAATNRLIDQALKSLRARRKNGYRILDVIP